MPMSLFTSFSRIAVLAGVTLAVAACATQPAVTSFTDPAYRNQVPKNYRMAIVGVDMSLMEQRALEGKAVEIFDENRIASLRGQNVLPPTQTYTADQARAALRAAGAELLLEVTALDRQRYDGSGGSGLSVGFGLSRGLGHRSGAGIGVSQRLGGRHYGDNDYANSEVTYRARLVNLANGDVMWQGDAVIQGGGTKFERHAEYMAKEVIEALIRDRMIIGSAPTTY